MMDIFMRSRARPAKSFGNFKLGRKCGVLPLLLTCSMAGNGSSPRRGLLSPHSHYQPHRAKTFSSKIREPTKRLTPMAASGDPHRTTTDSLRSFSPFPASDMLCALRAEHAHTFTGGTTRTRARPERGCCAEHDRDGRDRAVHRDSAGHSGYGRAAMPPRI